MTPFCRSFQSKQLRYEWNFLRNQYLKFKLKKLKFRFWAPSKSEHEAGTAGRRVRGPVPHRAWLELLAGVKVPARVRAPQALFIAIFMKKIFPLTFTSFQFTGVQLRSNYPYFIGRLCFCRNYPLRPPSLGTPLKKTETSVLKSLQKWTRVTKPG